MDWISKLLRGWRVRIVAAKTLIIGLVAVRAPVAFELARVGVDYNDALIEITVRDVSFVCFGIDENLRDSPEVLSVVAAGGFSRVSKLREKFSVLGELENLRVICPVAADPHIAFVIDGDAVIGLGPLIALAGAAPMTDQIAGLIELENGRRL